MVPELRPRGIGEILDSAVALYRARFTKLARRRRGDRRRTRPGPERVRAALGPTRPLHARRHRVGDSAVRLELVRGPARGARRRRARRRAVDGADRRGVYARSSPTRTSIADSGDTRRGAARCGPACFAVVGTSLIVLVSEAHRVRVLPRRRARSRSRLFAVAVPVLILEGVGRLAAAIGRSVTLTKAHAMHVLGLVLTAQLLATVLNGALAERREPPAAARVGARSRR